MARGAAEHVEGAGDLGLGAHDGTHQGGFAAARGAQEAGDPAGFDSEAEAVQDGAGASYDREAMGLDGGTPGIHHVMNIDPGVSARQEAGPGLTATFRSTV